MYEYPYKLLDRVALAKWLEVSPQTISNRMSSGGDLPPSFKSGNLRRWREQDVLQWIDERIEATSENSPHLKKATTQ